MNFFAHLMKVTILGCGLVVLSLMYKVLLATGCVIVAERVFRGVRVLPEGNIGATKLGNLGLRAKPLHDLPQQRRG